jgi:hypothetical protein
MPGSRSNSNPGTLIPAFLAAEPSAMRRMLEQ